MLANYIYRYLNYTALSSAATLTPDAGANGILIQAVSQNIYITFDGSTPSSTNGLIVIAGQAPVLYTFPAGTTIKMIQAASSAVGKVLVVRVS